MSKIWSRRDYLKMSLGAVIVFALNYALFPPHSQSDVGPFLVSITLYLLILYVIPVIIITVVIRSRRR